MQVGLTQEVYVNGSVGDIYVLGGWANAKSVLTAYLNVQGNIAGLVDSGNSIVIEYKHDQRVIYGPIGHALRRRVNIQLGGTLSADFANYNWRGNQLVHISDGTNALPICYGVRSPAMAEFSGTRFAAQAMLYDLLLDALFA